MAHTEFNYESSNDALYIETVKHHGAVVMRNFLLPDELAIMSDQIMAEPFVDINQMHGSVHEQFGLVEWKDIHQMPASVRNLAQRMGSIARSNDINWLPNAARAQLYSPGKAGVEWHRDFKSSLFIVGVANVFGEAQFDFKIGGEEQSVVLTPGDVAFLRNTDVNPGVDDRVEHRVHAPLDGTRLSLGIRQDEVKK